MLLDPQVNANALSWAQNDNKTRTETSTMARIRAFYVRWTYVESLTTLARPYETCVRASREGFTGHRNGPRNPVLWTPGAKQCAHLRWLKLF